MGEEDFISSVSCSVLHPTRRPSIQSHPFIAYAATSVSDGVFRMRTFCFSLLPLLILFPFTSWSGQHSATSRDGRQFLLDANDNANANAKANPKPKPGSTTSPILRSRRLFSLTSCRGFGLHGAPCTTGENSKYAGRCCRGECRKLRTWIREGCTKPISDLRRRRANIAG